MAGRHLNLSTLPIFPKHQSPAPIRQFFLSLPTLPSLTGVLPAVGYRAVQAFDAPIKRVLRHNHHLYHVFVDQHQLQ